MHAPGMKAGPDSFQMQQIGWSMYLLEENSARAHAVRLEHCACFDQDHEEASLVTMRSWTLLG
jgi:hypothetical protein